MDKKDLEQTVEQTVEQGFNDSELEDIMNEIESLEKEFAEEAETEVVAQAAPETETSTDDLFDSIIEEGPVGEAKADESLSLNNANDNTLQSAIDQEVETIETEMNVQSIADDLFGDLEGELNAEASTETVAEEVTTEPVMEETINEPVMDEAIAEPVMTETVVEEVAAEPVMVEETVEEVIAETPVEDNVVAFTPKASSAPVDGMSLSASGSMDMNLTFPVGDSEATLKIVNGELCVSMQGVELVINDQDGCTVNTEGGVKFTIPLTSAETDSKKKAI